MFMHWRRVLFPIGLSLGLLLFLRQLWAGYKAVQHYKLGLSQPAYLLAALALSLLFYALQMSAWVMIMRYLGHPLGLRQTLQGYLLSFLPRYIPGSLWGYWSRSHWLEQYCGIDYTVSILGSVLEASALILTALSVAAAYFCTSSIGVRRFVSAGACAGLLCLTWLILPKLAIRVGYSLAKRSGMERPQSRFREGNPISPWLAAVALYMALWMTYGSSILLTGNALLPTPWGDLLQTTFASSLSWLLGFAVIIVPTGIGIRELTLSALLSMHSNLLPWQANLVAVTSRFEIILAELGWLMVGLGLYICRRCRGPGQR